MLQERNCEEVILVKLKRKLSFSKGHLYFKPVGSQRVRAAFEFIQKVNPLCQDVLQTLIQIYYQLRKTP